MKVKSGDSGALNMTRSPLCGFDFRKAWSLVVVAAVCAAVVLLSCAIVAPVVHGAPPAAAEKALRVYFVDVEGGQATLFVTPEGQSLLIDTGWPANEGRDADRIVAAAKLAGLSKIDYVLITHFHMDH